MLLGQLGLPLGIITLLLFCNPSVETVIPPSFPHEKVPALKGVFVAPLNKVVPSL